MKRAFLRHAGSLATVASLSGCASTSTSIKFSTHPMQYPNQLTTLPTAFGSRYDNPELQAYVQGLGEKLVNANALGELHPHFMVLDSSLVNSLCMADGGVFITRGLLALNSRRSRGGWRSRPRARSPARPTQRTSAGVGTASSTGCIWQPRTAPPPRSGCRCRTDCSRPAATRSGPLAKPRIRSGYVCRPVHGSRRI